jgi:hypothetical protein
MSLLAYELSHEPTVKQAIRRVYRRGATVSTRPTEKGINTITPFSG